MQERILPQKGPVIVAEFLQPLQGEPMPYKAPAIWTRETIAYGIAFSYSLGRGIPGMQSAFFEWQKIHQGVDPRESIYNLLQAGGVDCFVEQEQQLLATLYLSKDGHAVSGSIDASTRELALIEIQKDLVRMTSDDATPSYFSSEKLQQFSWEQFFEKVQAHYRRG